MTRLRCGFLFVIFAILSTVSEAKNYPSQPVKLIVPFSPGGSTDASARLLAAALTTRLGQPVIVENKPGGGANIGTEYVAHARPDGYTVLLASATQAIDMAIYRHPHFDLKRDFAPVAEFGTSPVVLLKNVAFPPRSVAELVVLAKHNPGKYFFASAGVGSLTHLTSELFNAAAGIDVHHVPYKGAGPAMNDVAGGQVQMMFGLEVGAAPYMQAGRLVPLAVSGQTRIPDLPDVPTLEEAGIHGVDVDSWYGILVPAGTPPEVIAKLNGAIAESMKDIGVKLHAVGIVPHMTSADAFGRLLDNQVTIWKKAVLQSHMPMLDEGGDQ
ncbi:tripartite tricarboxylate transporter substrate binding protein [Paraburkholderia sediminicola]|uniref:tripartite tricarboxylate transporter substrate binding protein n=1 Tax=Paraburkholderia sediminicola TaxID=458836 RepID=UPI0038B80008